jgi:6-phosphogluconolactonase
MEPKVKIFETVTELAEYFASYLALCIEETPVDCAFSWLLSGGNTPGLLFRKIAAGYHDKVEWNRVKFFWGDERCVDPGDEQSNYRMARENLLDHIPVPDTNIFRLRGEEDPAKEAHRYTSLLMRELNSWVGIPKADLILLGVGHDGHTASVFPENIELFTSMNLFEPSVHPRTNQQRITATGRVINRAKRVVMIATGLSKASIVAQVIHQSKGSQLIPAALVKPNEGELLWLLDKEAAADL